MIANKTNQTLALAALFQAADCVRDVAWRGQIDSDRFARMMRSLLVNDADSLEAIYGGIGGLHHGLSLVAEGDYIQQQERNMEIMKYTVSLMALERKLQKNPNAVQAVQDGIQRAEEQAAYFDNNLAHDNVVAGLAEVYKNTISAIGPRIMVQGNQLHLGNTDNTNKIRALLLSGIRAALLWHQAGGGRLKLLLSRSKLMVEARRLLDVTS